MLTIRHLLTHSEGFPEDNPWGDRQLAIPDDEMGRWLRAGIPFSTAPGTAYEYSNYGFAILGRIVRTVSGEPYARYLETNILRPLGMASTTLEMAQVPATKRAMGYRWQDDRWLEEPPLPHGSFGPMGGLWTSTRDSASYVAFMMSAFPPRDDEDPGPVRRASVREMQQLWRAAGVSVTRAAVDAPVQLTAAAYGYGLRPAQTCRFDYVVGHGGGLPGYGSLMQWLPDYGVGLIALGNVTYAGWSPAFSEAWEALAKTGGLRPRRVRPAPSLLAAQGDVTRLVLNWDDAIAQRIAADNLLLDWSAEQRKAEYAAFGQQLGTCRPESEMDAENALRGTWKLACERGTLSIGITLAPTSPPRVQSLSVRAVMPPDARMANVLDRLRILAGRWDAQAVVPLAATDFDTERARRQLELVRTQWGACRVADAVGGNGTTTSLVRFECDRGPLLVDVGLDAATSRLQRLNFSPGAACLP